jgi:hypothetical protein
VRRCLAAVLRCLAARQNTGQPECHSQEQPRLGHLSGKTPEETGEAIDENIGIAGRLIERPEVWRAIVCDGAEPHIRALNKITSRLSSVLLTDGCSAGRSSVAFLLQ